MTIFDLLTCTLPILSPTVGAILLGGNGSQFAKMALIRSKILCKERGCGQSCLRRCLKTSCESIYRFSCIVNPEQNEVQFRRLEEELVKSMQKRKHSTWKILERHAFAWWNDPLFTSELTN